MAQHIDYPITPAGLPYVDRKPNPDEREDQRRIEWIRNGECLGGAEYAGDNSGELNRGPVAVQKNTVALYGNDVVLDVKIKEVIDRVNSHDDALGSIGDSNLATELRDLKLKVDPIDNRLTTAEQEVFLNKEYMTFIDLKVGNKVTPDLSSRNVFQDLLFIKRDELGNWENYDFNGEVSPGNAASGIKYRITNLGQSVGNAMNRIENLENQFINSDTGEIKALVDQLRVEIGPSATAPAGAPNIYSWISDAELAHDMLQTEVQGILANVGDGTGGSINDRITGLEIFEVAANSRLDHAEADLSSIHEEIGSDVEPTTINYRLKGLETDTTAMYNVLGRTADLGLRAIVNTISEDIGSENIENSIKWELADHSNSILSAKQDIATLRTQVGDNTGTQTGLFRRVKDLEDHVVGPDGTAGLVVDVSTLKSQVTLKLDDAPNDTKKYARSGGAWVEVTGGSGSGDVEEAPMDGELYVRKMGIWENLYNNGGLTIPEASNIKGMTVLTVGQDAAEVDIIGVEDLYLNIGDSNLTTKFAGAVDSFAVDSGFTITSNVASSSADVISVGTDKVQIGDPGKIRPILHAQAAEDYTAAVKIGSDVFDIWHKGNFADNTTTVPQVRIDSKWDNLSKYIPVYQCAKGGLIASNIAQDLDLVAGTNVHYFIDQADITPLDYNDNVTVGSTDTVLIAGRAGVYNIRFKSTITKSGTSQRVYMTLQFTVNDVLVGNPVEVPPDAWKNNESLFRVDLTNLLSLSAGDIVGFEVHSDVDATVQIKNCDFYMNEI